MSSIIEVVALALQRKQDGRFLIARRGPGQSGAGHWEFPGGKVESGETRKEALAREIQEEFSFTVSQSSLEFVDTADYSYPAKVIRLYLFQSSVDHTPEFVLTDHDQIAWCTPTEMKTYPLSPGDVYFIDKLL